MDREAASADWASTTRSVMPARALWMITGDRETVPLARRHCGPMSRLTGPIVAAGPRCVIEGLTEVNSVD